MAHQISVFVENKPGRLERVTEVLAKAKVNIRAFTVSGHLRIRGDEISGG